MSSKSKTPVDGYSREEYEAGLKELGEARAVLQNPPHAEELAIYTELRGENPGAVFPFSEEEHRLRDEHDEVVEGATRVEGILKNDLHRMLANAEREANDEDTRRAYAELLPKIEEAKGEISETLQQVSGLAPAGVLGEAREVLSMGNDLAEKLKSERPVHTPSFIRELLREFLKAKEYILTKLRKWLGMQNKFGGPLEPA